MKKVVGGLYSGGGGGFRSATTCDAWVTMYDGSKSLIKGVCKEKTLYGEFLCYCSSGVGYCDTSM